MIINFCNNIFKKSTMQDLTLVPKIHFFKDSKGNYLKHIMIVIIKIFGSITCNYL